MNYLCLFGSVDCLQSSSTSSSLFWFFFFFLLSRWKAQNKGDFVTLYADISTGAELVLFCSDLLQWMKCWGSNHKSNSSTPHLLFKLVAQKCLTHVNKGRSCRPVICGVWLHILDITARGVKSWGMKRLHAQVVCSSTGPRAELSGVHHCEHRTCLDGLTVARGMGWLNLQLQIALFCTWNHLQIVHHLQSNSVLTNKDWLADVMLQSGP